MPTETPPADERDAPWIDAPAEAIEEISLASTEADHQATRILRAKAVVDDAKDALKGCEHDYDAAMRALQDTIARWTKPPQPDLFNAPKAADDAWRAEPLSTLSDGLSAKQIEKLEAIDVRTVGDLADWLAGPPQRQYTDLPGFGEAKAAKLEEALMAFWAKHPGAGTTQQTDAELNNADDTNPESDDAEDQPEADDG